MGSAHTPSPRPRCAPGTRQLWHAARFLFCKCSGKLGRGCWGHGCRGKRRGQLLGSEEGPVGEAPGVSRGEGEGRCSRGMRRMCLEGALGHWGAQGWGTQQLLPTGLLPTPPLPPAAAAPFSFGCSLLCLSPCPPPKNHTSSCRHEGLRGRDSLLPLHLCLLTGWWLPLRSLLGSVLSGRRWPWAPSPASPQRGTEVSQLQMC